MTTRNGNAFSRLFMAPSGSCSESGIVVRLYGEEILVEDDRSDQKIVLRNYEKVYTAEEICYSVAKEMSISAVAYPLFALLEKGTNGYRWLNPKDERKCSNDSAHYLQFRIRFVPSKDGLSTLKNNQIHRTALNYLFFQMRDDFLSNKIIYNKSISESEAYSKSLGLAVIDKIRYGKESDIKFEALLKVHSIRFVPGKYKKEFNTLYFGQKKLETNFKPYLEVEFDKYKGQSDAFVKAIYIEALMSYADNYGSEEFRYMTGTENETLVTVQPFDLNYPGIKIENPKVKEGSFYHSKIEDLMDVSITDWEGQSIRIIHINRKQGQPLIVKCDDTQKALSMVSLLDGYFRLMEDYSHSLCKSVEMDFVNQFKVQKCHGPVSKNWAKERLLEKYIQDKKRNHLLKLSQEKLGNYTLAYIDSKGHEHFHQIHQSLDNKYRISRSDRGAEAEEDVREFDSIRHLLDHYKQSLPAGFALEGIVIPSNPLDPSLYLCSSKSALVTNLVMEQKSAGISIVSMVELKEKLGEGEFTDVYKSHYNVGKTSKEVAIKKLMDQHSNHLEYFCDMIHKMSFWGPCNTIVSVMAVCLLHPVSMVMEYAPYGNLKEFLMEREKVLSQFQINSAAEQIAQALYHLQEVVGQVHGNIQCKNNLVFKYEDKKVLLVKLADPGIVPTIHDNVHALEQRKLSRLPWLAPECRFLGSLTLESDRYAFGTTLWEIYSFGKSPNDDEINKLKIMGEYILHQPKACPDEIYAIMEQCWNTSPDHRINVKDVVRDLRQLSNKGYGGVYNGYNIPMDVNGKATVRKEQKKTFGTKNMPLMGMNGGEIITRDFGHFDSCDSETPLIGKDSTRSSLIQSVSDNSNLSGITDNTLVDRFTGGPSSPSFEIIYSNNREISKHDLKVNFNESPLGQGHYGKVFKGKYQGGDGKVITVAIKCLKPNMCHRYHKEFEKEYKIMESLRHENIVCVIGRCVDLESISPLVLVLEFVELGCLRDYLNNNRGSLGIQLLLQFGNEIALGMEYLANMMIVHRDLAARNVLLTSDHHVKIGDFGLSRALSPDRNYYRSDGNKELPAPWCAPESLLKHEFTEKTDIWSYGVTLWEIFSYGDPPHFCEIRDLLLKIHSGERLPQPKQCPPCAYNFIKQHCWDYYPDNRSGFATIVKDYPRILKSLK